MGTLSYLVTLSAFLSTPESPPEKPAPPVRRFTLVYTLNSFGETEPVGCPHRTLHDGGLARRMSAIRQIDAAEGPVLVLDGGASLFPDIDKAQDNDRLNLLLKAELICEAYNRMGYQAMAVGTSELLLGLDELLHLSEVAKFPLLSANLQTGERFPFKPYTVVEVAGLRIGIMGFLIESIGRVYLQKAVPDGKVLPTIDAARKVVEELRGKVDLIIAISHVKMETNRELAKTVPGIDIVIDPSIEYNSHHPRVKDPDWENLVGGTLILRADGRGTSLGSVNIEFRKTGAGMGSRLRLDALVDLEKKVTATEADLAELRELQGRNLYTLRRLPLSPHYLDDLEAAALINAHKDGDEVAAIPAFAKPTGRDLYLTAEACKDCHLKQYENWTNTRHSKALEGILSTNMERRPECITCHTTGYGPAFLDPEEIKKFGGVQCEACHGTQPEHVKDPEAYPFSSTSEMTCLPCHNKDFLNKPFSYYMSLKKVQCPKDE